MKVLRSVFFLKNQALGGSKAKSSRDNDSEKCSYAFDLCMDVKLVFRNFFLTAFVKICLLLFIPINFAVAEVSVRKNISSEHLDIDTSFSALDISARLEKCRVQLRDLEKKRSVAQKFGNVELFESLVTHAEQILKQIDERGSSPENYLLLGECQGILTSLQFSLDMGKYGGTHRSNGGKGPSNRPANPSKRQMVSTANRTEPHPKKYTFDDEPLIENAPQAPVKTSAVHHSSSKLKDGSMSELNDALLNTKHP